MKKIFTLLLVIYYGQLTAQVDSITIGSVGLTTPYPFYSPAYRFSATSTTTHVRGNMLVSASELSALGLPNGAVIHAIAFRKFTINTLIKSMSHKMYLANSSRTSFASADAWSTILGSHLLVYSNTAHQVPLDSGWAVWNISPFSYTGQGLEIATEQEMAGNGGSDGYISWRYDATVPANYVEGQTKTGSFPDTLNGTNTNYLRRPHIRIYYSMGALPVDLLSFGASRKGKEVQIDWLGAKEENLQQYVVERSVNGRFFESIGQVDAVGNSHYQWTNVRVPADKLYYRLKLLEKDGSYTYSKTVSVKAMQEGIMVEAYPNPFTDKVTVKLAMEHAGKVAMQVMAADGKLLHLTERVLAAGISEIPLQLSFLPKGNYYLKVLMKESVKIIYLKK